MNKFNLEGQRFGKLKVISRVIKNGRTHWLCQCDCKTEKVIYATSLRSGATKSCGCGEVEARKTNHLIHGAFVGGEVSPTRQSWRAMMERCTNPNHEFFKDYGGRGIKVCKRWTEFKNFLADMGLRPDGKTIDRKDTNGNYEKGNCRWATASEQRRNRRDKNKSVGIPTR